MTILTVSLILLWIYCLVLRSMIRHLEKQNKIIFEILQNRMIIFANDSNPNYPDNPD